MGFLYHVQSWLLLDGGLSRPMLFSYSRRKGLDKIVWEVRATITVGRLVSAICFCADTRTYVWWVGTAEILDASMKHRSLFRGPHHIQGIILRLFFTFSTPNCFPYHSFVPFAVTPRLTATNTVADTSVQLITLPDGAARKDSKR